MIASVFGFLAIVLGVGIATALVVWAVICGVRFIRRSNASLKEIVQSNESLVCDLRQAAAACSDEALRSRIQEATERLRFSDSAITTPLDGSLRQEIARLSAAIRSDNEAEAAGALRSIDQLVQERNATIALERRGSF